jgi:hypothetical protein
LEDGLDELGGLVRGDEGVWVETVDQTEKRKTVFREDKEGEEGDGSGKGEG